jgi:hypothetical protein
MKRLHPLHDAGGALYPELDWRWVTGAVMVEYLDGISRDTLSKRTARNEYGKGREQGVRHLRRNDTDRGRMEYRPAVIWMRLGMGRYGDQRFTWQMLDGKVTLYACPRTETPRVVAAQPLAPAVADAPLQVQAIIADLARAAATALAMVSGGRPAIPFPGAAVSS